MESKGANFKLELQFILLLVPCYFRIPSRRRVGRRYQREVISVIEISFEEPSILCIEHAVGVQEREIAFVGFLCSAQDHGPVLSIVLEDQVGQVVVDEEVSGDCQPCWSSPART